jgi:hypothetical protein
MELMMLSAYDRFLALFDSRTVGLYKNTEDNSLYS